MSLSLKTSKSRNIRTSDDLVVCGPTASSPKCEIRVGQAKYKLSKHGALVDLPFVIKQNKNVTLTQTPVTPKNIKQFMERIKQVCEEKNSTWYFNGYYQSGTER